MLGDQRPLGLLYLWPGLHLGTKVLDLGLAVFKLLVTTRSVWQRRGHGWPPAESGPNRGGSRHPTDAFDADSVKRRRRLRDLGHRQRWQGLGSWVRPAEIGHWGSMGAQVLRRGPPR